MELKLDAEGYAIDADGKRYLIDGEPLKIGGALSQETFDKTLGERLAKEKEKVAKRIQALEEVATKTPAIERELEEAKAEKSALETQLKDAEKAAADKVSSQLEKLAKERGELDNALKQERAARVNDQVTNLILGTAKDRFVNPAGDIVPRLLGAHKREPVMKDGKVVEGQYVDVFKSRFKNDKGDEVEDYLPVDKALEAFASDPSNAHYLRPSGRGGAGGGQYESPGAAGGTGGFQYETMK